MVPATLMLMGNRGQRVTNSSDQLTKIVGPPALNGGLGVHPRTHALRSRGAQAKELRVTSVCVAKTTDLFRRDQLYALPHDT